MNLYVTSDKIGSATGGGAVTANELQAINGLGDVEVYNLPLTGSPFDVDTQAVEHYRKSGKKYILAHVYAGCYTELVRALKEDGTKVVYTVAAHDVSLSKLAHEDVGIPFDFLPHLTEPEHFHRYIGGYLLADVVIVPSSHSDNVVRSQGVTNTVIIPHGTHLPPVIKQDVVGVGYLGSPGADKGLIHLIRAWSLLGLTGQLTIAGHQTESLLPLIRAIGKGSFFVQGFVQNVATFYNSIGLYIQPSTTEGFGLEVLEAMSYGRAVICSSGAGASDLVTSDCGIVVPGRNPRAIAEAIRFYLDQPNKLTEHGQAGKAKAANYTWDIIRKRYQEVYATVLA